MNLKRIGVAADHGGFSLKELIKEKLTGLGYEVKDFGAHSEEKTDDYPDFVIPLARAVSRGDLERGIAVCGSGVGAGIAANKISGVRSALITDIFSAHQGVEDDNMNIICLGGRVVGPELAWDLVQAFLNARFSGEERHRRRLAKVAALEKGPSQEEL
ncbi:MAG TPA: RpiB/LacA/LacB family sugar-phosphate isomerase [Desulfomonilaceae bacterium]|nr:RpiB/LacA/LacB family sugar-phosphate isomerase [Desulfomonilaceae bacterium]